MEKAKIQEILFQNFADFWPQFLLSEIYRFRKMTELAGNPTDAHILQVVAWSYLLSATADRQMEDKDFDSVLSVWNSGLEKLPKAEPVFAKRLTVSSIAHQTSIAFETVRRRLAKLEKKGIVTNTKEYGILLNPDSEFNRRIVQELNQMEQKSIVSLFYRFCTYREV